MAKDTKLISAMSLAIIKKLIGVDSAEYYRENRNELYAILDRANYRFHNDKQQWVTRKFKKRRVSTRVRAETRSFSSGAGATITLLRVIAPARKMDYILSQMNELFPCLNAEVLSTSKRYPGDGTWERVYLRIRFNEGSEE